MLHQVVQWIGRSLLRAVRNIRMEKSCYFVKARKSRQDLKVLQSEEAQKRKTGRVG